MNPLFSKFRNLPISRLILISMVLIALLPLVFLLPQIHSAIWDKTQRDITEKHLLLARNLTEPLKLLVESHQDTLKLLASTFQQFDINQPEKLHNLLSTSVNQTSNFNTLALLSVNGQTLASTIKNNLNKQQVLNYQTHRCFKKILETGKPEISLVQISEVNQRPVVMLGQPVFNADNHISAVLLSELSLEPVEAIRARIRFGENGHSVIVDRAGNVIAHPDTQWTSEIRNLSKLSIVRNMMAGKSGVMNFYSPYLKSEMTAGYASIPELGWGVMVPQPREEIDSAINKVLYSLLGWLVIGLILALVVANLITRWITEPINQLAARALELDDPLSKDHRDSFNLQPAIESAPCEIVQMSRAMQKLVNDLHASSQEVNELNNSLQDQINHATSELRAANNNLKHIASSDHLTTIANRRHFESTVSDILDNRPGSSIGIMLVDIDNFKQINDCFGHAAGDYVLTTVAKLLNRATRPGDIIARYGGDEFVAEFESDPKTVQKRAEQLRKTVEEYPFTWKGITLRVTLSIGITCHKTGPGSSLDKLMTEADAAMYQAKNAGRNKVAMITE